jgi:hypothetical protein
VSAFFVFISLHFLLDDDDPVGSKKAVNDEKCLKVPLPTKMTAMWLFAHWEQLGQKDSLFRHSCDSLGSCTGSKKIITVDFNLRRTPLTKGICTPRALTAHLIGSIMSITGTVQPGDKFLHAILPKHHFYRLPSQAIFSL